MWRSSFRHSGKRHSRSAASSRSSPTLSSYRLVWIDNGSRPESRAALLATFARHSKRLSIWSGRNLGFVGGVNVALRAILGNFSSDAEYVVLLNNDTEVTPQWLERLIGAMERDPSIAAAGPMTSPCSSWQAWPNVFAAWGEQAPESGSPPRLWR